MFDFCAVKDGGVLIRIMVQPRASRNEIAGLQENELKIRLTATPVEGAANDLCRQFLSRQLHIPKRDITIAAGEKSRHKRLFVKTEKPDYICNLLKKWLVSR